MTKRRPLALGAAATIGFGSLFFAAPALAEDGKATETDLEIAEAPLVEAVAPGSEDAPAKDAQLTDEEAANVENALKVAQEDSDVVIAAAGVTSTGFIVITLDEDGTQNEDSPEVAEVLSTFEEEIGTEVQHKTVPEIATPYAATDVVGGSGYLSYDATGELISGCSLGFAAEGPNGPAFITAGHCTGDGSLQQTRLSLPSAQPANGGDPKGSWVDNGTGVLGTFGFSQFGGPGNADAIDETQYPTEAGSPDSVDSTDIAVIDVVDETFDLYNKVTDWSTADDNDLAAGATPITSVGEPTVGSISKAGRTTGLTTGQIADDDVLDGFQLMWADNANTNEGDPTRWVRGFQSSVRTEGGDSGGAMFQGDKAIGVVSGGTATYTWGTSLTHGLSQIPGDYKVLVSDPNEVAPPAITAPANGSTVQGPVTEIAGSGEPGADITVTGAAEGDTTVGNNGKWTVSANITERGEHTVTAAQTTDGDTAEATSTFTVTDEAQVEDPTITTPKDGDNVDGPATKIPGSGEPGADITVTGAAEGDTTVGDNGKWTVSADIADAGEYTVTATQTAGDATAEVSSTFTVKEKDAPADLLAPEITSITDGDIFGHEDAPSSISGLGEPGAEVDWTLEGEVYSAQSTKDLTGPAGTQADEPGNTRANTAEWVADFEEQLEPGTYTFTATQSLDGETSPEVVVSFEVTGAVEDPSNGPEGNEGGNGDDEAGTDDGDLANTGTDSLLPFAIGAVLLLAAGGGAILIAQRRQAGAEL